MLNVNQSIFYLEFIFLIRSEYVLVGSIFFNISLVVLFIIIAHIWKHKNIKIIEKIDIITIIATINKPLSSVLSDFEIVFLL